MNPLEESKRFGLGRRQRILENFKNRKPVLRKDDKTEGIGSELFSGIEIQGNAELDEEFPGVLNRERYFGIDRVEMLTWSAYETNFKRVKEVFFGTEQVLNEGDPKKDVFRYVLGNLPTYTILPLLYSFHKMPGDKSTGRILREDLGRAIYNIVEECPKGTFPFVRSGLRLHQGISQIDRLPKYIGDELSRRFFREINSLRYERISERAQRQRISDFKGTKVVFEKEHAGRALMESVLIYLGARDFSK